MIAHNIREIVRDMKECPHGFHVQVWAKRVGEDEYELSDSEWLSQNSWVVRRDPDPEERCISASFSEARSDLMAYDDFEEPSTTAIVRKAIEIAWRDDE